MSASSQPVSSSGAAAQQQPAAGTLSNNAPVDSVALLTQEAQLTAPDSVMEVNVLDVLKEYMKAGGKVQTAVQDLSDGYMGRYKYTGLAVVVISSCLQCCVCQVSSAHLRFCPKGQNSPAHLTMSQAAIASSCKDLLPARMHCLHAVVGD